MKKRQTEEFIDTRPRRSRGMYLTERDLRIFEHIHAFDGWLSFSQIHQLEFAPAKERQTRERLAKLWNNGYLNRSDQRGAAVFRDMIYWLDKRGAQQVAALRKIPLRAFPWLRKPSFREPGKIIHDLYVRDFILVVMKACALQAELKLFEWLPEGFFNRGKYRVAFRNARDEMTRRYVYPDGYFAVDRVAGEAYRGRFLFEMDRSTHSNTAFADEKVMAYIQFIRTPDYARRFGANTGRILLVAETRERIAYLLETVERSGGKNARLWHFADISQVTPEAVLLEPIWLQADSRERVALMPPPGLL